MWIRELEFHGMAVSIWNDFQILRAQLEHGRRGEKGEFENNFQKKLLIRLWVIGKCLCMGQRENRNIEKDVTCISVS